MRTSARRGLRQFIAVRFDGVLQPLRHLRCVHIRQESVDAFDPANCAQAVDGFDVHLVSEDGEIIALPDGSPCDAEGGECKPLKCVSLGLEDAEAFCTTVDCSEYPCIYVGVMSSEPVWPDLWGPKLNFGTMSAPIAENATRGMIIPIHWTAAITGWSTSGANGFSTETPSATSNRPALKRNPPRERPPIPTIANRSNHLWNRVAGRPDGNSTSTRQMLVMAAGHNVSPMIAIHAPAGREPGAVTSAYSA